MEYCNISIDSIVAKFESKDSHQIWEATWDIIRCNDIKVLRKLQLHLASFRHILTQIEMGGALTSNKINARLALSYIEDFCDGICRCNIYSKYILFNPKREAEFGLIKVLSSEINKELYEHHILVSCVNCSKKFQVKEIDGWHVPTYEWKSI